MAIYNPESLSAEEFINHDEILETLQYAKANKNNIELTAYLKKQGLNITPMAESCIARA